MPDPEIVTPRLVLSPVGRALAARIVAGDLTGLRPGAGWPQTDTIDGLRRGAGGAGDEPAGWLVTLHDGTIIGDCGWKGAPDADGGVEIGYGLAPAHHRRGYGTEAVLAFADWSLGQPGIRRLLADSLLDNIASRRVLEHAGFTLTRSDRQYAYYERGAGPS